MLKTLLYSGKYVCGKPTFEKDEKSQNRVQVANEILTHESTVDASEHMDDFDPGFSTCDDRISCRKSVSNNQYLLAEIKNLCFRKKKKQSFPYLRF